MYLRIPPEIPVSKLISGFPLNLLLSYPRAPI